MIRLDRFLANQGMGTRKEVKKIIKKGLVKVDGIIIFKDDYKFDETVSIVMVDDEVIEYKKDIYILMNKPAGFVCANEDQLHETVFDLLPFSSQNLFSVGRLDKDTTGVLLISNDGVLAHRLLSPSRHVKKCYETDLAAPISEEQIKQLSAPLDLGDFVSMPAKVQVLEERKILLYICEGKFHQVKRMMKAVGNEVCALKRIQFGPLTLGSLDEGEWRFLSEDEIAALREVNGK